VLVNIAELLVFTSSALAFTQDFIAAISAESFASTAPLQTTFATLAVLSAFTIGNTRAILQPALYAKRFVPTMKTLDLTSSARCAVWIRARATPLT
jgi:hypothetical protein